MTLLLLLHGSPAHAGYWVFTCVSYNPVDKSGSSGSYTIVNPNLTKQAPPTAWVVPGPQNNQFYFGQFGGNPDYATSIAVTITVQVVATWTHGNGQNDTNDPAPPNAWLCESSSSEWKQTTGGSADDGFGDPVVAHQPPPGATSATSSGSTKPPAHWTKCTVTGGIAKLPARTLKAEGDYGIQNPNPPFGGPCEAYVDFYKVTVHAQPYNFHQVSATDKGDGTLNFTYSWSSTSGNVSDMSSCVVYEHVVYPGTHGTPSNPVPYQPPSPPYNTDWSSANNPNGMKDPTELPSPKWPAQNIGPGYTFGDNNLIVGSFILPQDNVTPVDAPFTATQTYVFDDSATGETEVQIPGGASGGSGPFSITREVKNNTTPAPPYASPYGYVYTISKNGSTAQKVLTP